MKKFLLIVVSIVLLVACNSAPKKVTGVVAKFESEGKSNLFLSSGPIITFSDGRTFCLKNMPNKSVEVDSEIAIWYTGENAAFLFNDSISVIKPAPVTSKKEKDDLFLKDTIGLPLAPGEFDLLAKLVTTKGKKVTASDCQYVYRDKSGNRHALISIRRTNHLADPAAPVSQISVWVNGKNVPEDKIFFSYIIKPDGVSWFDDADPQSIKETIHSLLVMAGK